MTKAEQTRLSIESSGLEEIFVFTGFIAVVIFFMMNESYFSIMDMLIGSIFALIVLKSIYFIMVGFITSLASVEVIEEDTKFKNSIDRIDAALSELMIQENKKQIDKI